MNKMEEMLREDKDIQKITELFLDVLKKYNMDYVQFELGIERAYFEYQKEEHKREITSVQTGYRRDITLKAEGNSGEYSIELSCCL